MIDLIKAFLIGICASAPLGPVVLLVTQKSLSYGYKTGFSTGLGAAVIDTTYAAFCFWTVSLVNDFLEGHQELISVIGGLIIIIIGISMMLKKVEFPTDGCPVKTHYVSNFFRAMGMSLANPGTILMMFGVVAVFNPDPTAVPIILLVLGVLAGTVTFWFSFSLIASRFRKLVRISHLKWINGIFGFAVSIFGIVLAVNGLSILFK